MTTVFAGNIKVQVLRNGKVIEKIVRPLRQTPSGPVVKYKRRLWLVKNDAINISGLPVSDGDEPVAEATARLSAKHPAPAASSTELVIVDTPAAETPAVVTDFTSTDDGQRLIIDGESSERLLVDAGPGTGKTHTACLKVAALVSRDDIPPSRIWMISFTKTAVREIRGRLTSLLGDPADSASVRIATLDSLAWTIHSGFSKDAVLTGSYDDNIDQTLAKIRDNPDVREEFEKIRHVIVDEAQDIIGVRAELVLAIIDAVAPDCGVTVFADQAQAIYGFTEDEGTDGSGKIHLVEELEDREFRSVSLTEIHRTSSPALLRIFRDVRHKVLQTEVAPLTRGANIRMEIGQLADASLGPLRELKFSALPANSLVLMRQRSEVLIASSFNQTTPHRLRMSGLPVRVLPWPALLLWDYKDRRLTKDVFDRLWRERIAGRNDAPSADAVWLSFYETAGDSASVIDLHRLRHVLGRSNPPASFTSPEYGDTGPIIGTIHASKGREAEEVFLYLPPLPDQDDDHTDTDEEVRVMFVGATRARQKLSVGSSSGRRLRNVDGRFWRKLGGSKLQVEIGRTHDIDAKGLVGKSAFSTATLAKKAQERLQRTPVMTNLYASQIRELGWSYALETADKVRLGVLSDKVKADLREVATQCKSWPPPGFLPHIRSIGLRSIAVRADDSITDQLHEPWRTSGFLLAPMLLGICLTKVRK